MSKFIFNNSKTHTLLFKSGYIEIKPRSYIAAAAMDYAGGVFKHAIDSGQVTAYDRVEDMDLMDVQPTISPEVVKPETGMSEEELKNFLANKKETPESKAVVTGFGPNSEQAQVSTEVVSEPAEEVKTPVDAEAKLDEDKTTQEPEGQKEIKQVKSRKK